MWHAAPRFPLVFILALSLALGSPARPGYGQVVQGATMTVLKGEVALVRPDGSAVQPAPSGTIVNQGDQIRTLTKSGALITFFLGTEIELGEDSVLQVENVSSDGDQINVSLTQVLGTSLHRVQTLAEAGSAYRVEVGGAVALVRGTVFAVGHAPPHRAFYVQQGAIDCDQQPLQQGGYWNSGGQGCQGLQSFQGSNADPWSNISEGLGIAEATTRGHGHRDDRQDDDQQATKAQESESKKQEEEKEEEEQQQQEHEAQHKNTDKPGHEKNEDNPGHSDKH